MSYWSRVTFRTSWVTFGSVYLGSLPAPASQAEKEVVRGGGPSFGLVVDPSNAIEARRGDSRCRSETERGDRTDGAGSATHSTLVAQVGTDLSTWRPTTMAVVRPPVTLRLLAALSLTLTVIVANAATSAHLVSLAPSSSSSAS
jgi:hypothetical protein